MVNSAGIWPPVAGLSRRGAPHERHRLAKASRLALRCRRMVRIGQECVLLRAGIRASGADVSLPLCLGSNRRESSPRAGCNEGGWPTGLYG